MHADHLGAMVLDRLDGSWQQPGWMPMFATLALTTAFFVNATT